MQITHEEARNLIQFDSDGGLKAYQKEMLDSHLKSCAECRKYADSIQKMESVLRPLLQRQWNQQPIPFSISMLTSRGYFKITDGALLATRIAAVSVMFMVFMFSAWQFTMSRPGMADPVLSSVPEIPVPSTSTKLTSTQTGFHNCSEMVYRVQENDTLESIAVEFSVSKEELVLLNSMNTESVHAGMKVTIPQCNSAPTETAHALTTTFTPILRQITATPGG